MRGFRSTFRPRVNGFPECLGGISSLTGILVSRFGPMCNWQAHWKTTVKKCGELYWHAERGAVDTHPWARV